MDTTKTTGATAGATPCLAHGGERVFSKACRSCAAFALTCFPSHPNAQANGTPAIVGTVPAKVGC